jgi:hypothetical protein
MIEILTQGIKKCGLADPTGLKTAAYKLYDAYPKRWAAITRLLQVIEENVPVMLAALRQPIGRPTLESIANELAQNTGMNSADAMKVVQAWASAIAAATPLPQTQASPICQTPKQVTVVPGKWYGKRTLMVATMAFSATMLVAAILTWLAIGARYETADKSLSGGKVTGNDFKLQRTQAMAPPQLTESRLNVEPRAVDAQHISKMDSESKAAVTTVKALDLNSKPTHQARPAQKNTFTPSAESRMQANMLKTKSGKPARNTAVPEPNLGDSMATHSRESFRVNVIGDRRHRSSYVPKRKWTYDDGVRDVLVFHVPWAGNDALRREVLGANVEEGSVFSVRLPNRPTFALKVLRPLAGGSNGSRYWLAALTNEPPSAEAELVAIQP